jgi:small subunit ribosomal protein S17
MSHKRGRRIEVIGMVVSDKMQKTITVQVERLERHPKYGKFVKRLSVFKAHDESSKARLGDRVKIVESRPLSRTKRFRLVEILESKRALN